MLSEVTDMPLSSVFGIENDGEGAAEGWSGFGEDEGDGNGAGSLETKSMIVRFL